MLSSLPLRRVPSRRLHLVVLVIASGSGFLPANASSCWLPPVEAPVVAPFRAPACVWCPGNRGIEFGTDPGHPVLAVASGTVTFSGPVAGVGYVVVRHADGRRVTYGGLAPTALVEDDVVLRRSIVGTTVGPFHFGLREGDRYLDPTPYIGRPATRTRLLPADGGAGRPGTVSRARCTTSNIDQQHRPAARPVDVRRG